MLEVYYCPECYRIAYLAKNRASCTKCKLNLQLLDVPYNVFVNLKEAERIKAIQEHLLK